jgi:hypothetical protein
MSTTSHQQAFGNYPENFDKREARLIACGYSLLQVAATETYTMSATESYTHVTMAGTSGTTTLRLPPVANSLGRVVNVYVSDSTGTVLIEQADGTDLIADAAAGPYAFFCTSSAWVRVG